MKQGWEPVRAEITIIVDNTVMELIPGSGFVNRLSRPGASFLCEHGFSALIETGGRRVLVDTGSTGVAVSHNLRLLGIGPEDIDVVVLSHGHSDHTGGLLNFPCRIVAHPDSFDRKYLVTPNGARYDLTAPGSDTLPGRIEFHRGPVELAPGVWTTGEVRRQHAWELLDIFRSEHDGRVEPDHLRDDQGVAISSSEGLVIIAGCSHAGIINTVEQAIEISGISDVYSVIGGFHLIGPGERKIERTIGEFRRLKVRKVIPIHCTGFEGIKQISASMPEEFEYVTAGCRITV